MLAFYLGRMPVILVSLAGLLACVIGVRGYRSVFGAVGFGFWLAAGIANVAWMTAVFNGRTELIDPVRAGVASLVIEVLTAAGMVFLVVAVLHGRSRLAGPPPPLPPAYAGQGGYPTGPASA